MCNEYEYRLQNEVNHRFDRKELIAAFAPAETSRTVILLIMISSCKIGDNWSAEEKRSDELNALICGQNFTGVVFFEGRSDIDAYNCNQSIKHASNRLKTLNPYPGNFCAFKIFPVSALAKNERRNCGIEFTWRKPVMKPTPGRLALLGWVLICCQSCHCLPNNRTFAQATFSDGSNREKRKSEGGNRRNMWYHICVRFLCGKRSNQGT